nr:JmjC domain containing protein 4 [Hymenolepis microstoma]
MVGNISESVPYLDKKFAYADFYTRFLHPNLPCLFTQDHTSAWPVRSEWDENGLINIDIILKPFSCQEICVANCQELNFGTHPMIKMSAEDYLSYWKEGAKEKILYLKDCHYFRNRDFNDFYRLPVYFSSDWLNEFSDFRTDCDDDFRFVYIGPKGTWTPLHADVYCSFSWSANIIGLKRWWIFPPGEEKKLTGPNGGSLPADISDRKFAKPGCETSDFPQCYIFDQRPGEMFFVPSGWYHQVMNLTDCVSINNNWLNACNVDLVWRHLQSQLQEVKRSCSDVQSTPGWDEACQAWEGWNYLEFFLLVKYILLSRWLRKTWQEIRDLLPKAPVVSQDSDALVPLRILDEQVDNLLSSTAKNDPSFVERLLENPQKDDTHWLKLFVEVENVSRAVREHDLSQAIRTIYSMLRDSDLQSLGMHTRGPAAWLWKILIDN